MSDITLPKAVENFVAAANAHDAEALSGVFADGATVRDDGHTYSGGEEIRKWIQSDMIAPKVVISPISFENGQMVASSDADIEGGPWTFNFAFVTKDDLVDDLTISLA